MDSFFTSNLLSVLLTKESSLGQTQECVIWGLIRRADKKKETTLIE